MARQKKETNTNPVWAICVHHPDDTCGWIVGEGAKVVTYLTQEEAEKALRQMRRNTKYSWSLPMEAREYVGGKYEHYKLR